MLKKLQTLFFLLVICLSGSLSAQTAVDTYGQLSVTGNRVTDQNGNEVQLRGMSLFWSQWEPEYYTYNTVKWLRDDWCINIIRTAMAVESGGYLTNPAAEEAKVRTVIEAAIDLGIYVLVDWHDHAAHEHQTQAIEFFTKIAEDYGDYPNIIYETYNEPLNVSWSNTLKPYHNAVNAAIRQHDSNNIIVCGTPNWSQDVDDAANDALTGSNLAYTLHYYAGTHGASLRGKADYAMNRGLCIFVTEYGTVNANGDGGVDQNSANQWYTWMDQNAISSCNWSIADKDEGASAITPNTSPDGNWTDNNLTTSGAFVRNYIKSNCPVYEIPSSAPSITSELTSLTLSEGDNTTLNIEATGSNLSYQWYLNGEKIDGATNSSLALNNVGPSNNGEYYVVVSNDNGSTTSNSAYVEVIGQEPFENTPILIPGTIEAENYDKGGAELSYQDSDAANEGGAYRNEGVDIEEALDDIGEYNIGWTAQGEWLEYTIEVLKTGEYNFNFRVAADGAGGNFTLSIDGQTITTVDVPDTEGWQNWTTVSQPNISLTQGVHVLRLTVESTQGFNVNYFTAEDVVTSLDEVETSLAYHIENNVVIFDENVSYTLFNSVGQILQTGNGNSVNISSYNSGMYFVQTSNQTIKVTKN